MRINSFLLTLLCVSWMFLGACTSGLDKTVLESPEYTFVLISEAIRDGDGEKYKKYINIDRLSMSVGDLFDSLVRQSLSKYKGRITPEQEAELVRRLQSTREEVQAQAKTNFLRSTAVMKPQKLDYDPVKFFIEKKGTSTLIWKFLKTEETPSSAVFMLELDRNFMEKYFASNPSLSKLNMGVLSSIKIRLEKAFDHWEVVGFSFEMS